MAGTQLLKSSWILNPASPLPIQFCIGPPNVMGIKGAGSLLFSCPVVPETKARDRLDQRPRNHLPLERAGKVFTKGESCPIVPPDHTRCPHPYGQATGEEGVQIFGFQQPAFSSGQVAWLVVCVPLGLAIEEPHKKLSPARI